MKAIASALVLLLTTACASDSRNIGSKRFPVSVEAAGVTANKGGAAKAYWIDSVRWRAENLSETAAHLPSTLEKLPDAQKKMAPCTFYLPPYQTVVILEYKKKRYVVADVMPGRDSKVVIDVNK